MKLLRLRVKDFLGIREADLDMSRPMSLVLGENGAGKSSLRDAALWCLAGRCRGTDAAGRGAGQLIHRGADQAAVELTFADSSGVVHVLTRMHDGTKGTISLSGEEHRLAGQAAERRLEELTGANADVMEICLDPLRFLALDGRTQSSLLSGAIGLRLTIEDLIDEATTQKVSAGACADLRKLFEDGVGFAAGVPLIGTAELESAHQHFYDHRRTRKRDLAAVDEKIRALPTAAVPTAGDVVDARHELQDVEGLEAACHERLGMLRRRHEERRGMEQRRAEIQERILELEALAKQGQPDLALAPSTEDLEREICDLQAAHRKAQQAEMEASERLDEAEAARTSAVRELQAATAGDASCPAGVTEGPCPVLLPQVEQRKASVPQLEAKAAKLEKAAERAGKAHAQAVAAAGAALAVIVAKHEALQAAREAAARTAGASSNEWDMLNAELDRIEEELGKDGPERSIETEEQALVGLANRKRAAQAKIDALRSHESSIGRLKELEGQRAAIAVEVDVADELVKALDPKALPAKILELRIGPVQKGLNQVLADITGGQYQVTLEAGAKGVELNVWKKGIEHPLFLALLSHSERLRLGTAISVAFALITPLRIIAIDEVDLLLRGPRGLLNVAIGGLLAPAGDLETVLMFQSADAKPTMLTDPPDGPVAVFWVEDGGVKELKSEAARS